MRPQPRGADSRAISIALRMHLLDPATPQATSTCPYRRGLRGPPRGNPRAWLSPRLHPEGREAPPRDFLGRSMLRVVDYERLHLATLPAPRRATDRDIAAPRTQASSKNLFIIIVPRYDLISNYPAKNYREFPNMPKTAIMSARDVVPRANVLSVTDRLDAR
jgi:hypothetical protein